MVGWPSTDWGAAAPATGGGCGWPLVVMWVLAWAPSAGIGVRGVCGSDTWPEAGVFWPIIVAAAAEIFGTIVIGPPFATSGWFARSAASSWQLW